MLRLLLFLTLLLIITADPRTPKVYNVLISSKKKLAPSHAIPVYEPVLKTSLGIALPAVYYSPPLATFHPHLLPIGLNLEKTNSLPSDPNQPLPVEQYIPYTYNYNGLYSPLELSNSEQPKSRMSPSTSLMYNEPEDLKNIIANLKKNPEIPDVPPPPLSTQSKI